MTNLEIARRRLHNQRLFAPLLGKPDEVVGWLGAVQAQDYVGAKWAVGQRLEGSSDETLERAFTDGTILRTHLLRPTWHFVTPDDIRWILAATAPRVNALSTYYFRQLELDDMVFARTNELLARALEGGKQLTRPELMDVLQQEGIDTQNGMRGSYIMMRAELDAVVCSGGRRGKQFTYALLDERVPQAKTLPREEALAELARCYFTSHGPATLQDLMWWASLTTAEAKAGLEAVKSDLEPEEIEGQTYWSSRAASTQPRVKGTSPTAYLLSNYDEYISYKDRSALFDLEPEYADVAKADLISNRTFPHLLVIDGIVVGTWKRTLDRRELIIETKTFAPLDEAQVGAVNAAAERYGRFLGVSARVT